LETSAQSYLLKAENVLFTEFAYIKREKKTIEELEDEELHRYSEKEELVLFLVLNRVWKD
jgi:hypothetical protein